MKHVYSARKTYSVYRCIRKFKMAADSLSEMISSFKKKSIMTEPIRNYNIFGTPQEPYFNNKVTGLTKKILLEWLTSLNEENEKRISCIAEHVGLFKYGEFAEFVFLTCEKFNQPDEVKYIALELFDSFMVKHIEELYKHFLLSEKYTKKSDWLAVQERIRNQVMLRITSCCQIASKLNSHYKVVLNSKIRKLLTEFGHNYSNESILQSEMRVLKTLNYKLSISSPVLYLETILELLGLDDPTLQIKVMYVICIKILDIVYLEHRTAYSKLYCSLTGQHDFTASEGEKFSAVENNKVFLAVSIIATGAYIMDQKITDKNHLLQNGNVHCGFAEIAPLYEIVGIQFVLQKHFHQIHS